MQLFFINKCIFLVFGTISGSPSRTISDWEFSVFKAPKMIKKGANSSQTINKYIHFLTNTPYFSTFLWEWLRASAQFHLGSLKIPRYLKFSVPDSAQVLSHLETAHHYTEQALSHMEGCGGEPAQVLSHLESRGHGSAQATGHSTCTSPKPKPKGHWFSNIL